MKLLEDTQVVARRTFSSLYIAQPSRKFSKVTAHERIQHLYQELLFLRKNEKINNCYQLSIFWLSYI
jgi:hypothetical protein